MLDRGISSEEAATTVQTVTSGSDVLLVIGSAPTVYATEKNVNKPILCYSKSEFTEAFGYVDDTDDNNGLFSYSLCEAAYTAFDLYGVSPVIFVNVLEESTHKKSVALKELKTLDTDLWAEEVYGIIKSSVVVKNSAGDTTYELDTDYTLAYDSDGYLQVVAVDGGAIDGTPHIEYDKLDPSAITQDDIIGGTDTDGDNSGLECLEDVYSKYNLVVNKLWTEFSSDSEVAAISDTKMQLYNGNFQGISMVDIDTDSIKKYSDVPAERTSKNLTSDKQILAWPMGGLGDKIMHLALHQACLSMTVNRDNDNFAYESPSNKSLKLDKLCLKDGTEVTLNETKCKYLEDNGVTTGLSFGGGLKSFGNYTACKPDSTDVKDYFINVKSVFINEENSLVLNLRDNVDDPGNLTLIKNIVNSYNLRYNSLTSQGKLLGGRIEFLETENSTINLLAGKYVFHHYLGVSIPAKNIHNIVEYDVSYLETLFQ
ncbi:phage tail sheath family protein [Ilyobacter polytropus]|uniref:Tail sheath protein subtilisin-like domain-containing protein n=1 Tax=Ilyobacter polytropus (strain ATCC 51220 / DSM 2926 / LMG 16218 / CuHBu1) TaxID=572544 RepID=E3HBL6_ILYPC|nr:hypothetical protein [Ilyobacter polytropus]ADO83712.1 conserved hypothetical protein [Ilyobacter polytropus DSM 2926]